MYPSALVYEQCPTTGHIHEEGWAEDLGSNESGPQNYVRVVDGISDCEWPESVYDYIHIDKPWLPEATFSNAYKSLKPGGTFEFISIQFSTNHPHRFWHSWETSQQEIEATHHIRMYPINPLMLAVENGFHAFGRNAVQKYQLNRKDKQQLDILGMIAGPLSCLNAACDQGIGIQAYSMKHELISRRSLGIRLLGNPSSPGRKLS